MPAKLSCNGLALTLLPLLALGSQVASAAEAADRAPHVYVEGALASVEQKSPASTGTAMNLEGSSNRVGVRAAVGLAITPFIEAKAQYFQLPSTNVSTLAGAAKYSGSDVTASLVGVLPLPHGFALSGQVGYGRSDAKVDVDSTGYRSHSAVSHVVWGVGARCALSPALDLTLNYDDLGAVGKYANGGTTRAAVGSLGLRFNF